MEQTEQTDIPAEGRVAIGSLRGALSNEVRASLEAVRVSREAAHVRARQQTRNARLAFAAAAGALVLAAFAVAPRVARWRQGRLHPAAAATPLAAPAPVPMPAPAAPAARPAPIAATDVAAPGPTIATPALAVPQTTPAAGPSEGCDMTLVRKAPWRISPDACARAFDANPNDATLALAIAHAEHVRGRATESSQWASRALSIDANTAEAYVLIARAHLAAGHDEDARTAYRRYLELAPRGWHRAEASAAIRR